MIFYNEPMRANERAAVVPLDNEELKRVVNYLNEKVGEDNNLNVLLVQRLIDDYENLRHLKAYMGGEEGAERLKSTKMDMHHLLNSKKESPKDTAEQYILLYKQEAADKVREFIAKIAPIANNEVIEHWNEVKEIIINHNS